MDTFSFRRIQRNLQPAAKRGGWLRAKNAILKKFGLSIHPTKGFRRDRVRADGKNHTAIAAHFARGYI